MDLGVMKPADVIWSDGNGGGHPGNYEAWELRTAKRPEEEPGWGAELAEESDQNQEGVLRRDLPQSTRGQTRWDWKPATESGNSRLLVWSFGTGENRISAFGLTERPWPLEFTQIWVQLPFPPLFNCEIIKTWAYLFKPSVCHLKTVDSNNYLLRILRGLKQIMYIIHIMICE